MRLLLIAALAVSCTPVGAPIADPGQRFALYQYVLEVPTKPVSTNEQLKLVWKGQLAAQPSSALFELQLCAALFGPWETVEALKKGAPQNTISCPPAGAIATSEIVRTASNNGAPQASTIKVPSAPGFYDLRQISVYDGGNAWSAGSIIEVR